MAELLADLRPLHEPASDLREPSATLPLGMCADRLESSWYPDCMVCMGAKRAVRFDCGHLVCCQSCSEALMARNETCPVCRQTIGREVFDEFPPLLGRQPTYEGEDVALQRLVKTLSSDNSSSSAKEEAAFVVCQRASTDNAQRFVDAGVVAPLVALVAQGGANKGRDAATITIGILADRVAEEVISLGGVSALLPLLSSHDAGDMVEYAALALLSLFESSAAAAAAAVHDAGGLTPLIDVLQREDLSSSALGASASVLIALSETGSEACVDVVKALVPLAGQLRCMLLHAQGGAESEDVEILRRLLALAAGPALEPAEPDGPRSCDAKSNSERIGALRCEEHASDELGKHMRKINGKPKGKAIPGCVIS